MNLPILRALTDGTDKLDYGQRFCKLNKSKIFERLAVLPGIDIFS